MVRETHLEEMGACAGGRHDEKEGKRREVFLGKYNESNSKRSEKRR